MTRTSNSNHGVGSHEEPRTKGWREEHRKQKHLATDHRAPRESIERHRGNVREDPKNEKARKKKGYNPLTYFRW